MEASNCIVMAVKVKTIIQISWYHNMAWFLLRNSSQDIILLYKYVECFVDLIWFSFEISL